MILTHTDMFLFRQMNMPAHENAPNFTRYLLFTQFRIAKSFNIKTMGF